MITFRKDFGCWWPDYDSKPEKCFKFVQNGLGAIAAALPYCKKKRKCIQAGGHAGHWANELSKNFQWVLTFEPEPALSECLYRNTLGRKNISPFQCGLGAHMARVNFLSHISAGSWRVDPSGDQQIDLIAIDDLQIKECDAIFLDIEGYEVEALKGADETIRRCSPVILVEMLPRSRDKIHSHLVNLGYTQKIRYNSDAIYVRH